MGLQLLVLWLMEGDMERQSTCVPGQTFVTKPPPETDILGGQGMAT